MMENLHRTLDAMRPVTIATRKFTSTVVSKHKQILILNIKFILHKINYNIK